MAVALVLAVVLAALLFAARWWVRRSLPPVAKVSIHQRAAAGLAG